MRLRVGKRPSVPEREECNRAVMMRCQPHQQEDNKAPSNVNAPNCCISGVLAWPCSLVQCSHMPALSFGGPLGRRNGFTEEPPHPGRVCVCACLPASWSAPSPTQPLRVSCSFPLLSIASPLSLILPGYNPRPQTCNFSQKHRTSRSMDSQSCKGPGRSADPTPTRSLDWETEAQREGLPCLTRHCNVGRLDKLALGT